MSGTSLDGVDVVCCQFDPSIRLLGHRFLPMPADLRKTLLALQIPSANDIHLAMLTAVRLGHWYHAAVTELLAAEGLTPGHIRAIGCHGQTIRHRPADGYSVQLNQPALLAELTGIDVVSDFRSRDIAAGGQGAPLVPAFHQAVFFRHGVPRIVVNIGGMANLTNLPTDGQVIGFDCGPGNVLMDAWIAEQHQQLYDKDGNWAASGTPIPELLQKLLAHPFFTLAPPKSCGREEFNLSWLQGHLSGTESPANVQATLLELTAYTIAQAIRTHCASGAEVILCGGGAKNKTLVSRLASNLPDQHVTTTTSLGLPVDMVEATAFAWLAKMFIERQPGNLPAVTGAQGPRVLGALYPR